MVLFDSTVYPHFKNYYRYNDVKINKKYPANDHVYDNLLGTKGYIC